MFSVSAIDKSVNVSSLRPRTRLYCTTKKAIRVLVARKQKSALSCQESRDGMIIIYIFFTVCVVIDNVVTCVFG